MSQTQTIAAPTGESDALGARNERARAMALVALSARYAADAAFAAWVREGKAASRENLSAEWHRLLSVFRAAQREYEVFTTNAQR